MIWYANFILENLFKYSNGINAVSTSGNLHSTLVTSRWYKDNALQCYYFVSIVICWFAENINLFVIDLTKI